MKLSPEDQKLLCIFYVHMYVVWNIHIIHNILKEKWSVYEVLEETQIAGKINSIELCSLNLLNISNVMTLSQIYFKYHS